MSRSTLNSGIDLWGNVGTDVQYGITTGTSLSATINPDFGQVEADPARLNLSAFEERRPFFVKDSSIFQSNGNAFFTLVVLDEDPAILTSQMVLKN